MLGYSNPEVAPPRAPQPDRALEPYQLVVATDRQWEREIDELRIASYRTAGYFKLPNPDTVRRRTDPTDSLCLLLRQGPVVAATVRLAYVHDRPAAEVVLQGPVPLDREDFPAVTFCRGATDSRHRGRGLMSLLVALGVAVTHRAGMRSAIGMQADGTPHFDEIVRASWQSREVATEFAKSVSFETPTMKLVYLRRARMPDSIEYSNRRHAQILAPERAAPAIEQAAGHLRKMARS